MALCKLNIISVQNSPTTKYATQNLLIKIESKFQFTNTRMSTFVLKSIEKNQTVFVYTHDRLKRHMTLL